MLLRCASAMALVLAAGSARAGDKPVYASVPDWVKPAPPVDTGKLGDDAPLLLVVDQQQRLSGGEVWAYMDSATRIASGQMLNQAGTVQLPWQPDDGDLIIHKVEILRGAEQLDALAKGERFTVLRREEQLEQLQMSGLLTATMTVEGLRVGDVLRVAWSTTRSDRALGGNMQAVLPLVAEPVRTQFARARLLWDKDAKVQWRGYAEGIAPKPVTVGGFQELEVALPLPKAAELPADAPVRYRKLPILEAATFADWPSVSRTMAPLYKADGLISPGSALGVEVAKIEKAHTGQAARAAAALRLVQDEVRYLFRGMEGGNYLPQAPAKTWEVRYGDCKAKTLLLLALLDALDVPAQAVVASSQLGDLVPDRLPSPGAFDHVLVVATVDGKPLWLDGTGMGTRAEDMADAPPFRHVLPLTMAGAGLMPVPLKAGVRPDMVVAIELDQSAGFTLPTPYKAEITVRGPVTQMLQLAASQADRDQKAQLVQSMLAPYLDAGLTTERAITYDGGTGIARVRASGITTTGWKRQDGRLRFALDHAVSTLGFEPDRSRSAWRDIPVATNGPFHALVTTRIHLPDGGKGVVLEGDQKLGARFAGSTTERRVTMEDGWLVQEERIRSDGGEIAPAAIAAERASLAQAKTRLLQALAPEAASEHWQAVRTAKRDRRLGSIEAMYARAIADDPEKALPYSNRANYRAGIYDWKGALADVERVVALEENADNLIWRAYLHEILGDDEKALDDLKAAEALAPGSHDVVARLARFHSERGRVDAALALVDSQIALGGKARDDFRALRGEVLAQGGRTEDALLAMDEAVKGSPGNADLLNQRCWLKGTRNVALDTALKDCTKAIELAETPVDALDSRGMVYFRMNRMDDALADVNAALALSPGLPSSLYLRGIIRKTKGETAAADADLAAAQMQSPLVAGEYARYGIKP